MKSGLLVGLAAVFVVGALTIVSLQTSPGAPRQSAGMPPTVPSAPASGNFPPADEALSKPAPAETLQEPKSSTTEKPALDFLGYTTESLETIKEKLEGGQAVLIDVREQREWDAGHLRGASLVPLSEFNDQGVSPEYQDRLPKDKILYGYCLSGSRVVRAGVVLRRCSYDFRPLREGYPALLRAGFPEARD